MGHSAFSKPVFLKLPRTGSFQARSAQDALEYFDLHWPEAHSAHYRQAKGLCQSATEGLVDAEIVRQAVVDAANRAGLLTSSGEVDAEATTSRLVAVSDTWQWPASDPMDDEVVSDSDLAGYFRAVEIVEDPALSTSRKKALLAYWASDVHAVAGAPSLRCARGVTVTVDSLFEAMSRLDEEIDQAAMVAGDRSSRRSW